MITLNTAAVNETTLCWLTGQVVINPGWVRELMPTSVRAKDRDGTIRDVPCTVITYDHPENGESQITVVGAPMIITAKLELKESEYEG